jgi:predicted XRE-type DNA-binding protein
MNDNEMEVSGGNIYEDLGLANAAEMLVKAQLASTIQDIMDSRGLRQTQAAEMMNLPQPRLSRLLNGQFRGISEFKMLDCITRLGRDIQITIGPESTMPCGRIEVLHVV